jgi:hypothetical protein
MNSKFLKIKELKNAYNVIMNIVQNPRKPEQSEFIKDIYPLLEISVQWDALKIQKNECFKVFLEKCKQRVKTQSNFYGTIFEIDMASRGVLSNWDIEFVEDYSKEGKQIDFVFYERNNHNKVTGVECLSKRYSENKLTVEKINENIKEKAKKFDPEYIDRLGIPLDQKLLVIDITMANYSLPRILSDLEKLKLSHKLDGLILTWREDIIDGENHSLRTKYKTFGNIDKTYFSTTYAAEIHKGPVFFLRKYVELEPTWGIFGPEESLEDYLKKTKTR